jgi:hypothetical protein
MNPRYPSGGPIGQENIIELHTDDRNGTRFLYPNSGPSGPAVVDLANASYTFSSTEVGKAIPVFFTPPAVDPAAELTLRTVIENFGTTNEFNVRLGLLPVHRSAHRAERPAHRRCALRPRVRDAQDFDAVVDMPADLPAGTYYVGSIFDDLDEVVEEYEDNNAVVYCDTLEVIDWFRSSRIWLRNRRPAVCPSSAPLPQVTHPLNMAPLTCRSTIPNRA